MLLFHLVVFKILGSWNLWVLKENPYHSLEFYQVENVNIWYWKHLIDLFYKFMFSRCWKGCCLCHFDPICQQSSNQQVIHERSFFSWYLHTKKTTGWCEPPSPRCSFARHLVGKMIIHCSLAHHDKNSPIDHIYTFIFKASWQFWGDFWRCCQLIQMMKFVRSFSSILVRPNCFRPSTEWLQTWYLLGKKNIALWERFIPENDLSVRNFPRQTSSNCFG